MKSQVRAMVAVMALVVVVAGGWVWHVQGALTGLLTAGCGLAGVAGYGAWALRTGRHTPWSRAQGLVAPGHAVVFWKPGCPWCERLLRAVGTDERITWVNVWKDDAAQRVVCGLNDGNEYTPTALVGEQVLRNPGATELVAALGA